MATWRRVHAWARARRRFEAARGGTVFLDEIGELPLDMQPKLLRALEERIIKRVGSVEPIQLDVRVVAATNRNLRQAVNRGTFRADLYFRLNIVRIEVPPLRERRDDIAVLATSFYEQFTGQPGAAPPPALIYHLVRLDWPGNVRELRHAVERAVLMQDPELWQEVTSGLEDPAATPSAGAAGYRFDEALSFRLARARHVAWERWFVAELVRRHGGNLSRAAPPPMDRTHLRELVLRYRAEVVRRPGATHSRRRAQPLRTRADPRRIVGSSHHLLAAAITTCWLRPSPAARRCRARRARLDARD